MDERERSVPEQTPVPAPSETTTPASTTPSVETANAPDFTFPTPPVVPPPIEPAPAPPGPTIEEQNKARLDAEKKREEALAPYLTDEIIVEAIKYLAKEQLKQPYYWTPEGYVKVNYGTIAVNYAYALKDVAEGNRNRTTTYVSSVIRPAIERIASSSTVPVQSYGISEEEIRSRMATITPLLEAAGFKVISTQGLDMVLDSAEQKQATESLRSSVFNTVIAELQKRIDQSKSDTYKLEFPATSEAALGFTIPDNVIADVKKKAAAAGWDVIYNFSNGEQQEPSDHVFTFKKKAQPSAT